MKSSREIVEGRREELASLINEQLFIPLQSVCERFNISEATARRDLKVLEENNRIVRTPGGAVAQYDSHFQSFRERLSHAVEAKRALAETAASYVASGMTVFLDGGTTMFQLATTLSRRHFRSLEIVTNSLAVGEAFIGSKNTKITLTGGQFLGRQAVLLGNVALDAMSHFDIDLAFMSVEGITGEGLWNSVPDLVSFQKTVLQRSQRNIFVVDQTKLGLSAPAFLNDWDIVDLMVTDASVSRLGEEGVVLKPDQLDKIA